MIKKDVKDGCDINKQWNRGSKPVNSSCSRVAANAIPGIESPGE